MHSPDEWEEKDISLFPRSILARKKGYRGADCIVGSTCSFFLDTCDVFGYLREQSRKA
jgi:hypothetical protein